jgi:hypothetical protein
MKRTRTLIVAAAIGALALMLFTAPVSMAKDNSNDQKQQYHAAAIHRAVESDELLLGSFFWTLFFDNASTLKDLVADVSGKGRLELPKRPTGGENGCIMNTEHP